VVRTLPFFVASTAAAPIKRLDFREPVLLLVSLTQVQGDLTANRQLSLAIRP